MPPKLNLEVISFSEVPWNQSVAIPEKERPVVLVVDDERTIADTLSVILSKSGFAVLTAYDGASALELARIVPPELLISDVVMGPEMDGTELAMQIAAAYPDCRVLLFSGHASTMDLLRKARESGYDFTLLTKPVHPADLLSRIRESMAAPAMFMAQA